MLWHYKHYLIIKYIVQFVIIQYYTHYTIILLLTPSASVWFWCASWDCFSCFDYMIGSWFCDDKNTKKCCFADIMLFLAIVDYVIIIDSTFWICFFVSWSFGWYGSDSSTQEQILTVCVLIRIILIKVDLDHLICNSLGAF